MDGALTRFELLLDERSANSAGLYSPNPIPIDCLFMPLYNAAKRQAWGAKSHGRLEVSLMESDYALRSVVRSHPDYRELNWLQTLLCYAYNSHLTCPIPERMDIEPLLRPSLINTLKTAQGDLMDAGNFGDFKAAWARP